VIAKPAALRVQGGHERAGLFELRKDSLGARASEQTVCQRTAKTVQHRGEPRKAGNLAGLVLKDLCEQVLRHPPIAAGEGHREPEIHRTNLSDFPL
jgi:hypothetical protein